MPNREARDKMRLATPSSLAWIVLLAAGGTLANGQSTEIYKCQSDSGHITYAQEPCSGQAVSLIRPWNEASQTAPATIAPARQAVTPERLRELVRQMERGASDAVARLAEENGWNPSELLGLYLEYKKHQHALRQQQLERMRQELNTRLAAQATTSAKTADPASAQEPAETKAEANTEFGSAISQAETSPQAAAEVTEPASPNHQEKNPAPDSPGLHTAAESAPAEPSNAEPSNAPAQAVASQSEPLAESSATPLTKITAKEPTPPSVTPDQPEPQPEPQPVTAHPDSATEESSTAAPATAVETSPKQPMPDTLVEQTATPMVEPRPEPTPTPAAAALQASTEPAEAIPASDNEKPQVQELDTGETTTSASSTEPRPEPRPEPRAATRPPAAPDLLIPPPERLFSRTPF